MSRRIAVFSGGGADGGFTVGRLARLDNNYDGCVAVSTGALMSIHAILGHYAKLKASYIVNQKDIINVNAFTKKGKVNILNALIRVIKKKKTLGESEALKKLIDKQLDKTSFDLAKKFEIYLGVHSISYCENVFISNQEVDFEDFKDWVWISANAPLIMSIAEKIRPRGNEVEQWCDGGITEGTPLSKACLMAGVNGVVGACSVGGGVVSGAIFCFVCSFYYL